MVIVWIYLDSCSLINSISVQKGGIKADKSIILSPCRRKAPVMLHHKCWMCDLMERLRNAARLYEVNIPSRSSISKTANPVQFSFRVANATRCAGSLRACLVRFVHFSDMFEKCGPCGQGPAHGQIWDTCCDRNNHKNDKKRMTKKMVVVIKRL